MTEPAAVTDDSTAHPTAPRWLLRGTAVLLVALGIFPFANYLTLAEPQRWWGAAVRGWLVWSILLGTVALVLGRRAPDRWERSRAGWEARLLRGGPRGFAWFIGALTCLLALFFGWILFHFQAASLDELSAQWQAHLLAHGRLTALAEPHDEFFSTMQTVSWRGRWFAHFPIGGPALRAFGMLLHVDWLVNPVLAGVAAVAIYRFGATIGSELHARATALLFALSPFVLFLAATQRDHVATTAAIWIALALLPRWHAARSSRDTSRCSIGIGLCLGIATTIRPYDGALAAIAIGAFQLVTAGRDGARWRALAVQAIAGALPIAALLAVNRAVTGHPLTFAYDILNGPEHRPGFHMSPLGFEHTPRHGLYLVSSYLMRLNAALTGWPVPIVGVAALAMASQRRASRWDVLLLALLGTTLVGYFVYWGEGLFNGPRFLYTVAPVFLLYLARFPSALRARLQSPAARATVSLLIPLWLAAAWCVPILQPFSVWSVAMRTRHVDVVAPRLVDASRRMRLTNALVFVDDGWQARLTARMRALGVPPFVAAQLVERADACDIQRRLDDAERNGAPRERQAESVTALLGEPSGALPVPGLTPAEQIALVPGRPLSQACIGEAERVAARGVDMARLLPLMSLDSLGRLGGDVVYARDFGARDELLRDRFGDRAWFTARVDRRGDSLAVVLAPYGGR